MSENNIKQETILDRAVACLWGGAVGDAMGKTTEGYSQAKILETYGHKITNFEEPIQPLSQFTWAKAEITEDTRQLLAVSQAIIDKGEVDQLTIARQLLHCDPKGVGTSSRMFYFILTKDIGHVATKGSGNGAATRIAPVGIVNRSSNLHKLVEDVAKATIMTHGGRAGIAGAAAMAAAVSAAVEGWPAGYVMLQGLQAAKLAVQYGFPDNLPPVWEKIQTAIDLAAEYSGSDLWERVTAQIGWGFSATEAVPAALVLACTLLDAKDVILYAVNQGGDADAVAGMAGALAAAINPSTLPAEWVEEVRIANKLNLVGIARQIVDLRPPGKTISMVQPAEIGG